MKKIIVQLCYSNLSGKKIAVTFTGYPCEIGLPKNHHAIVGKRGSIWEVHHVESGMVIHVNIYGNTKKEAIMNAKYKIKRYKKEYNFRRLKKLLEWRIAEAYVWREEFWNEVEMEVK